MKSTALEIARNGITINLVAPERVDTERLHAIDEYLAEREGSDYATHRRNVESAIPAEAMPRPMRPPHTRGVSHVGRRDYITGQTVLVDGGLISALRSRHGSDGLAFAPVYFDGFRGRGEKEPEVSSRFPRFAPSRRVAFNRAQRFGQSAGDVFGPGRVRALRGGRGPLAEVRGPANRAPAVDLASQDRVVVCGERARDIGSDIPWPEALSVRRDVSELDEP